MNCIIPFESKLKFNNPVKEICSISLEHEITQNEHEILGNFLISGTYKEHELSVNTTDFKFTVPFSVELTNRIEQETLEFSIDNFTYDINDNEMTVNIDYIVSADDEREEIVPDDPLELIEEPLVEAVPEEERVKEVEIIEEEPEVVTITDEVNVDMMPMVETENDYITYHVHVVKENETYESISLNYKVTKDDLEKFNDLSELQIGSKLIIPLADE